MINSGLGELLVYLPCLLVYLFALSDMNQLRQKGSGCKNSWHLVYWNNLN